MKLKASKESAGGLNTEFVNVETGRRIPLERKRTIVGTPTWIAALKSGVY